MRSSSTSLRRPCIGSVTLSVAVAFYVLLLLNLTFWGKALDYLAGDLLALAALGIGLAAIFVALCVTVSVKYVAKPFFIAFILIAAAGSWFMDSFGVVIDLEMVRNAAETSGPEAGHLLTPAFAMHMMIFGLLPSFVIAAVRIQHRPFLRKVGYNLLVIVPCLALFAGAGLSQAGTFAFTTRQHRDWFETLNPLFPVASGVLYLVGTGNERGIVAQPVGTDARVSDPLQASTEPTVTGSGGAARKPRVTIIVVGETARGDNFQLGGYVRATNPELERRDIVYFRKTSSCGTATAVSVPCMFSAFGHDAYSHAKGLAHENLMDVLVHAGVHAEWWDNNTGSKGMAVRIPYKELYRSNDPRFCSEGECHDDILLDQLDAWLGAVRQDSVLVLHQLGSHGPGYFQRYPEAFRQFKPDCRSAAFSDCHRDEIINAYDNSILYTDHVLATIIDKLAAREGQLAPAMIYMSDHGESLGEKGLFLHGAPWVVAPEQQTHIPFVLWLGPEARAETNAACFQAEADKPQSHDNLYHTVLGLMHVETSVRKPSLDLMATCRKVSS